MAKHTHLSLDETITIQQMLGQAESFKAVARILDRNCFTISKEFRNHLVNQKKGGMEHAIIDCTNRFGCCRSHLGAKSVCPRKNCSFCS